MAEILIPEPLPFRIPDASQVETITLLRSVESGPIISPAARIADRMKVIISNYNVALKDLKDALVRDDQSATADEQRACQALRKALKAAQVEGLKL